MNRVNKIFNSMYVRIVIGFMLIVFFANVISFTIMFHTNTNEMMQIRKMLLDLPNTSHIVSQVGEILRKNMTLSMIFSSIFAVIIIYIALKPIKKMSKATKLIANGNFDVEVKRKGNGEIAELVNNFNKMTQSLKNNEYLHKDFVSSVSHEIKTPITAISGYAELLKDKTIPEEQKEEYVNIIISESKRLTNLSTNLLKLSELDNKIIYSKKEFSIDEQIRRVILLLQNKWEQKNIELELDLNEVKYWGDEELFELVWINLINNAIKFTNNNGKIFIKLIEANNEINITIKDTGIGIDEKDKEYIFERFYIADKSRHKESTGLGLSIVKKIISLSDGEINFESEKNIGTAFYIKLNI
jgi:Signal transduction histidine kinase